MSGLHFDLRVSGAPRDWLDRLRASLPIPCPQWGAEQAVQVTITVDEPRPGKHTTQSGKESRQAKRQPHPTTRHTEQLQALADDVMRLLVGPVLADAHQVVGLAVRKRWSDRHAVTVQVDTMPADSPDMLPVRPWPSVAPALDTDDGA